MEQSQRGLEAGGCRPGKWRLPALLLIILTVCAYLPVIHGTYIWDDNDHLTDNPLMRNVSGLMQIWFHPRHQIVPIAYYPVTLTLSWLEYQVIGLDHPGVIHMIDVCLHALNSVLIWLLLRRLKIPWAWFAAAIFSLHPIQVETVAWISEQKNLLSGLFSILAVWNFLNFIDRDDAGGRRHWQPYALCVLFFTLAMLSKAVVAGLPIVMLLIIYWKHKRITWRDGVLIAPLLAISAALSLLFNWVNQDLNSGGTDLAFTGIQRVLLGARCLTFYTEKFLWPFPLVPIYQRWQMAQSWWEYLFPAGVALVIAALWLMRNRLGRGPLVAALSCIVILFPALGFVNFSYMHFSFVADHFAYLAVVPLGALIVAFLNALFGMTRMLMFHHDEPSNQTHWTIQALGGALIVTLAGMTWIQASLYNNGITLWRHAVKYNPDWMPLANLADVYHSAGDWKNAENAADLSIAKGYCFTAFDVKGLALQRQDHPTEAAQEFRDALGQDGSRADGHFQLGQCLDQMGDYQDALGEYKRSAELDPTMAETWSNLSACYLRFKQWADGATAARRAIECQETYANAHCNLAIALQQQGDVDGAIGEYQRSVELDPKMIAVRLQLGNLLLQRGDARAAANEYQKVIAAQPDSASAQSGLAAALAKLGDSPNTPR